MTGTKFTPAVTMLGHIQELAVTHDAPLLGRKINELGVEIERILLDEGYYDELGDRALLQRMIDYHVERTKPRGGIGHGPANLAQQSVDNEGFGPPEASD